MSVSAPAAAIIGGGIMGADIAVIFASGGWSTHVVEPSERAREALPARLTTNLARMERPPQAVERVTAHAALGHLPWNDIKMVVECVPEDLALKQNVFRELDVLSRPGTPLTSNSSSFPISAIGEGVADPSRIAGLHFFMPAHLVPLVEVVRCETTAPKLLDEICETMRELGKVPVKVQRDIPGFLANRIQHALMREALALIDDGIASAEDVDAAVRFGFGFRYIAAGPLMQKDLAGLDTHYNAARTIYPDLCNATAPSKVLADHVAAGELGMKCAAKKGFFEWTDEAIERERARYESLLSEALGLIHEELPRTDD